MKINDSHLKLIMTIDQNVSCSVIEYLDIIPTSLAYVNRKGDLLVAWQAVNHVTGVSSDNV